MSFKMIRANIVDVDADAIVSSDNENFTHGGGVSAEIFEHAGARLATALLNQTRNVGEVLVTPGFDLKQEYILHVATPAYTGNPEDFERLKKCYAEIMRLALNLHIHSIAFPVLGNGSFGFPDNRAVEIAKNTLENFSRGNNLIDITLVLYDDESFSVGHTLTSDIESFITSTFSIAKPIRNSFVRGKVGRTNVFKAKSRLTEQEPKTDIAAGAPQDLAAYSASLVNAMNREFPSFFDVLSQFIDKKKMDDVEAYKRANVSRKLFSKMKSKDYHPRKRTVLAFVIALSLNEAEAEQLLNSAGFALTNTSRTDVIVMYFMKKKNFDIYTVNEALFDFNEKLLP
jgi:O-acetyl-ADP-ribose deacetylase (regulator of RNase III)